MFPGPVVFLQGPLKAGCSTECFVFTGVQVLSPVLHKCGARLWIYCLTSAFVYPPVRCDNHACQVPIYRQVTCTSDFFSSLLFVLSCTLAGNTHTFHLRSICIELFMKRKWQLVHNFQGSKYPHLPNLFKKPVLSHPLSLFFLSLFHYLSIYQLSISLSVQGHQYIIFKKKILKKFMLLHYEELQYAISSLIAHS